MKIKKIKVIRQGDLVYIPNQENYSVTIPSDLKKADTDVIIKGSGGHDHKVVNGEIYFKQSGEFVLGFLKANKNAKLLHAEHGVVVKGKTLKEADLPEGVYQIRRQVEETNEGLRPVLD